MVEVGQEMHGTVIRVLPYGAIVRLDDGTVGLVHISELDNRYVSDVREYCNEGAQLIVRVISRKSDGRWEFSLKQVGKPHVAADETESEEKFGAEHPMYPNAEFHPPAPRPRRSAEARAAFDEKMRDFLSDSSERIEDVRRHHDHRLHGKRR